MTQFNIFLLSLCSEAYQENNGIYLVEGLTLKLALNRRKKGVCKPVLVPYNHLKSLFVICPLEY